jgi:hypothetical protein
MSAFLLCVCVLLPVTTFLSISRTFPSNCVRKVNKSGKKAQHIISKYVICDFAHLIYDYAYLMQIQTGCCEDMATAWGHAPASLVSNVANVLRQKLRIMRSMHVLFRVLFWDSVVGVAIGYGMDDGGVRVWVPVGSRIFYPPRSSRPALGPTQPPIQWVRGDYFPGVKALGAWSWPPQLMGFIRSLLHTPSWRST